MQEGPKFILALSVLVLAVMFGAVALVDAAEAGKVFDDGATGELAILFLGIAGASVGLSVAGISWKRAKEMTQDAKEFKEELTELTDKKPKEKDDVD